MSSGAPAPEGFYVQVDGRTILLADERRFEELTAAGLSRVDVWEQRLAEGEQRPGRGGTAVLRLGSGLAVRLKQLRRGGLAGPLWRQRFVGTRRLVANVCIPLEVARRDVDTPRPIALLTVEGPSGLFRGWLAMEEIAPACDLLTAFASRCPPTRERLTAAMVAVRRMHDRGVEHRDLNLGNVLLQSVAEQPTRALVIDLDAARLHDGPLEFSLRQQGLRRFERSYVKSGAVGPEAEATRELFYRLYAGDDAELLRRLERGRRAGRGWILVHRLGWRR